MAEEVIGKSQLVSCTIPFGKGLRIIITPVKLAAIKSSPPILKT